MVSLFKADRLNASTVSPLKCTIHVSFQKFSLFDVDTTKARDNFPFCIGNKLLFRRHLFVQSCRSLALNFGSKKFCLLITGLLQ